jgi:HlyD family secretion protein
MSFRRRVAFSALLLGVGASALSMSVDSKRGVSLAPSAHAQGIIRNLIARLRGQTLPDGIVKSNGRIEATQVDVSSKYAGRLSEVTVEEGSSVTQGQVIARVSSPEYEAQLRAAQADLQRANHALASAEADIGTRQSALDFAKSDFERGQELIKTGFITKQVFEQRKRSFEEATSALQSITSQRDQAQAQIKSAQAEVERIESIIHDLTLVSPRNGRVQYQLARAGEVVAAGAPIVTILDLTDVYMTIFLPAADAGRLAVGDEARIILDPIPDYVIPASVSFVAADAQFTPKTVETTDERAKLMFRIKLRVDAQVLQAFYTRVKTGIRGLGFVRTKSDVEWPADLQVKLPKPPADKTTAAPAADSAAPQTAAPATKTPDNNAAETKTPDSK